MADEPIKASPETPAATPAAMPAPSAPRAEGGHSGGGAHRSEGHSGGGGPRREGYSGGGGGGQRRDSGPGGPGGGPGGPRRGGKRQYFRKKKVCRFCVERVDFIDYKKVEMLQPFVQERGKILPRRMK